MTQSAAVDISHLVYCYGARRALDDVSLSIQPGEIFALLGPNGSGKTTLFRLMSTLIPLQQGTIRVFDRDVSASASLVRRSIGVVFQSPSLDRKLTVEENLRHQGHLYGLYSTPLAARIDEMLDRVGLGDRRRDSVESLSGGLQRRVELAKGLLHQPRLLLLDEPSTGLDPGARSDLWDYLQQIRREAGVTIILTSHLLDEADQADRLAILREGKLVALGTPDELRATVGGDSITIETSAPDEMAAAVRERFELDTQVVDGRVRIQADEAHGWVARLVTAFPDRIDSITVAKPTLEDVFILRTGHRFWNASREVTVG